MCVCLFISKITRKVLNGLEWNFQEALLTGQTDVLVMFQIPLVGRKSQRVGRRAPWAELSQLVSLTALISAFHLSCSDVFFVFISLQLSDPALMLAASSSSARLFVLCLCLTNDLRQR